MEQETTNLFRRRDTIFGVCEALGQDFGFNPLWLRLALVAPIFFFPFQTFIAYFGLGLVVLVSRIVYPDKRAASPSVTADNSAVEADDTRVPMPLAA